MSIKTLQGLLTRLSEARPRGRFPPCGFRRVRKGYYRYGHPIWLLEEVPEIWDIIEFIRESREQQPAYSWGQIVRHLRTYCGKSPSGQEWTTNSAKGLYRRWKNKVLPLDYVI